MTPPLVALVALALSGAVAASAPPALCDVSGVILDVKGLTVSSEVKPYYIGWGSGTHNYTCEGGKYSYTGELAEIIDISCLAGGKVFPGLRKREIAAFPDSDDVWNHEASVRRMLGPEAKVLGMVYSNRAANGSITPSFDFSYNLYPGDSSKYLSSYWAAYVTAPKATDAGWWEVGRTSGSLADYVYKVDTLGGQPPAACKAGHDNIEVRYSAKYYFYGKPGAGGPKAVSNNAGSLGNSANLEVDPSSLQKVVDFAPAILGLLVITTLLTLALVVMGALSMCRSRRASGPTRSAAYRPVQLPRVQTPHDGTYHDDPEPYGR